MTTPSLTDHHARLVVPAGRAMPTVYAVYSGEELARDPFVIKRCVEHLDRLLAATEPDALPVSVMTWEHFEQHERQAMLRLAALEEIDEARFFEALEVVPPAKWHTKEGLERFFLGEATKGSWAQQYARLGERYVTKLADMTDPSTWITREDFA